MKSAPTVVTGFSPAHVVQLTGLSIRQLAYWDKIGFFRPEYLSGEEGQPYARVYSFNDVVGLRTISVLKNVHKVSMRHLRDVGAYLAGYSNRPWSEIELKVWNRRVIFNEPGTGQPREVLAGQYILLPIIEVMDDVNRGVEKLRHREVEQVGKMEQHRHVAHNKKVFAGTRIPVRSVLNFLEDGYSPAEIIAEYPSLTEADIKAAMDTADVGKAA